jgi:hypothetical protein
MKNPLIFAASCPACRQQRLQHAHTRRTLIRSIETNQIIDAYCPECDLVWPISTLERALIACAIAVKEKQRVAAAGGYGPAQMGCVTEWIARFEPASRPRAAITAGGFQSQEPGALSPLTDRPLSTH